MAFQWKEYKEVARYLNTNREYLSCEEAALRSAVGRFYYAAFGHAREYAVITDKMLRPKGPDAHKLVIEHFDRDPRHVTMKISAMLRELKSWRNICDYENSFPSSITPKMMASKAALYANKIIEAL